MVEKKEDYEIIDTEEFSPESEQQFSHQKLVMKTMNKCLEAGCKEMRSGYYNNKEDKHGNMIITYVEDTRKTYIECVETLEDVMSCDLDKDVKKEIKKIKKNLNEEYKKLCLSEKEDWEKLNYIIKKGRWKNGVTYQVGRLNKQLLYYHDYIEEQIRAFRMIFKALTKLTSRLGFYEEEALIM